MQVHKVRNRTNWVLTSGPPDSKDHDLNRSAVRPPGITGKSPRGQEASGQQSVNGAEGASPFLCRHHAASQLEPSLPILRVLGRVFTFFPVKSFPWEKSDSLAFLHRNSLILSDPLLLPLWGCLTSWVDLRTCPPEAKPAVQSARGAGMWLREPVGATQAMLWPVSPQTRLPRGEPRPGLTPEWGGFACRPSSWLVGAGRLSHTEGAQSPGLTTFPPPHTDVSRNTSTYSFQGIVGHLFWKASQSRSQHLFLPQAQADDEVSGVNMEQAKLEWKTASSSAGTDLVITATQG